MVGRLREALDTAGYEYDAVVALLGPQAHQALSRNETTPGLRATGGGGALETLVRLWLLQAPCRPRPRSTRLLTWSTR
jgi:hypothetical protein